MATEATPDHELRAAASGGSLSYDVLNPEGFERLCFHIILARRGSPRFWGRRGQKQHGIDLILSDGSASTVYQCKHYASFGAPDLDKALGTFRRDWLDARPELGRPRTFVLCTSAKLKDTANWEKRKRSFKADTGVNVEEWHRGTLDGWLRDQPGMVADLFGNRMAELFCGCGRDWDLGVVQPLVRGTDERIDRYLDLRDAGRIIRHTHDESELNRVLGQRSVVLLGGLAGTGKTMAALDLASGFDGGSWRVFYLRPTDTHHVDQLFAGIRDRAFRLSIFVLDDCHLAFDRVEPLIRRLVARRDPQIKLVLIARTPPENVDFLDPSGVEFVDQLRADGQVIDVMADETRYWAIVGLRRPEWSDPPFDRLMSWTGRDLAILDLVLDVTQPTDLKDITKLEGIFPSMLHEFWDGAKSAHAPNLKQLAAMAQFDVPVPIDAFPDPLESSPWNARAANRFIIRGNRPAAFAFHHPSTAELVFRLLSWAHGEQDPNDACARDCAAVLVRCADLHGPDYALSKLLSRLLRTRLKLTDDGAMKGALLTDERVTSLFDDASVHVSVVTLSLATFLCRDLENPPPYAVRLAERLEGWAHEPTCAERFELIGVFLRTLKLANPDAHQAFERRVGPSRMKDLIAARGTLVELLKVLEQSTDAFAADLLRSFDADEMAALAKRVDAKKSIGTLNLALRELSQRPLPDDPDRTQLHLLEERLGASRMKDLIAARGTLVELLGILQYSTDAFAADLLRSFDADEMAELAVVAMKVVHPDGPGQAAACDGRRPDREVPG